MIINPEKKGKITETTTQEKAKIAYARKEERGK